MKRILNLIFLAFVLGGILHATDINECKTDIYFGNGVWNKQFSNDHCIKDDAAECSQKILNQLIQRDIIKGDPVLAAKYGTVKLQYNWSYGKMLDVLETYCQLKEDGQVNNLEFF